MTRLTLDQVKALAPDPASLKAGQGLANASKWQTLGGDDTALWGACKGSAAEPYKVRIDLVKAGYACTCPSRKFPCKHALGLMLLVANSPAALAEKKPPEWVTDWLAKRAVHSQVAEKKEAPAKDDKSRQRDAARRAAKREKLVETGIEAFDLWIKDLIRNGLATLPSMPETYWAEQAARLVDAQLPGAARLLRELAAMPTAGGDWAERFLLKLSRLYLLIQAYRKLDTLPTETQVDVRSLLGWTLNQDDLLAAGPGVIDDWLVVAQRTDEDEASGIRTQANWLWGRETRRAALILNFAHRTQALDMTLGPGLSLRGEMIYYPGAYPLRAAFKEAKALKRVFTPQGMAAFSPFLAGYGAALSKNPWLESFPVVFERVIPQKLAESLTLIDADGYTLPIERRFSAPWELVALSGGAPLALFGCWDGFDFLPMAAWEGERLIRFG